MLAVSERATPTLLDHELTAGIWDAPQQAKAWMPDGAFVRRIDRSSSP